MDKIIAEKAETENADIATPSDIPESFIADVGFYES